MRISVQVVLEQGGEEPREVREVFQIERGELTSQTLGLGLGEAKDLLAALQEVVVGEQVAGALAEQAPCPHCARARRHKDARTIVVRSLFGTLRLASPRWLCCPCRPQPARSFSPLAAILPERTTPELAYLEARFAGLVSYGLSARLLDELLPLGRRLHATSLRRQVQAVAQRLEDELGPEQSSFIEGCPAQWGELPRPDLPLTVGLDGGYVHSATQRSRRDGWFEVIAGRSLPAEGPGRCFGYVQTYDTKPRRRLYEVLTGRSDECGQRVGRSPNLLRSRRGSLIGGHRQRNAG